MLIVELEGDDFDKSEGFVKIGRLNSAIAKAKGANNLLDSERKIFPRINEAVQLRKLKPLDPETLTPLSKSDYATGIVTFVELVEWGQATKLFDFRRAQFTVKHIDGISTMNLAAYEEYQKALECRRAIGRYSIEEAAQFVENNSNANARSIFTKLKKSAETGELTIHWPGSNEVYKPIPSNPLTMKPTGLRGCEEAYWSDLNAWLDINELRLDCRFPEPNALAPAANVEAGTMATPALLTQANKLRTNNLDGAIGKAILSAQSLKAALVFLELKELALAGEKPFTGAIDGDALCYTDTNDLPAKLTKNALAKRLKRRAEPSQ